MGPVLQVMEMMRMTIMTRTMRVKMMSKIGWSGTGFIGYGDDEDDDNVINCPSR